MFNLGVIFFFIGTIVIFLSDILFKRGIITNLKSLLIYKYTGLGLTIISVILMLIKN